MASLPEANYTCVFMKPSLISFSKHIRTHPLLALRSTFPASQKIKHWSQLMSPIMASCDCPFIISLIISVIIIIISLLQSITLCSKEDSIIFWKAFLFVFGGGFFWFSSHLTADGKVHRPLLQLHLQSKKKIVH